MLTEKQTELGKQIRNRRLDMKPYWHLERARVGQSRNVPVEIIINGQAVERQEIPADGAVHDLEFEVDIERSSWVAVRVLPSMHSNPIFVHVAEEPIRASKKSAEWCKEAVDVCWGKKRGLIRPEEIGAAKEAYDSARATYTKIAEVAFEN